MASPIRGTPHATIDNLGIVIAQARAAADTLAALAVAGGLDSLKDGSLEQMLIDLHCSLEGAYAIVGSIHHVTH